MSCVDRRGGKNTTGLVDREARGGPMTFQADQGFAVFLGFVWLVIKFNFDDRRTFVVGGCDLRCQYYWS